MLHHANIMLTWGGLGAPLPWTRAHFFAPFFDGFFFAAWWRFHVATSSTVMMHALFTTNDFRAASFYASRRKGRYKLQVRCTTIHNKTECGDMNAFKVITFAVRLAGLVMSAPLLSKTSSRGNTPSSCPRKHDE